MAALFLLLQRVHENVHGFTMKLNYSEPKFFTGGVAMGNWPRLAKDAKKNGFGEGLVYLLFISKSNFTKT